MKKQKHSITRKTSDEIERLARGGRILRTILEKLARDISPGITGLELNAEADRLLREQGAEPAFKGYSPSGRPEDGFPATLCVSVNSGVVHGIPTKEPFREGDVVSIDLGCRYEGLYTDTATTVIVGNAPPEVARLVQITRDALHAGLEQIRPGVTTGDIGAAIQRVVESTHFGIVRDLVGHGVGYEIHEEPNIPNVGTPGKGIRLDEGVVIAVEPMVVMGNPGVEVAEDGWTIVTRDRMLAAHEEYTVAVVPGGMRLLTKAE